MAKFVTKIHVHRYLTFLNDKIMTIPEVRIEIAKQKLRIRVDF